MLAQTYNLDCDLVYQKQWRSSNVNKESIYNFLVIILNSYFIGFSYILLYKYKYELYNPVVIFRTK